MYKHILIPTDGSKFAMQGVEHGMALAKRSSSKVTVVTVVQPYPLQNPSTKEAWTFGQKETAERILEDAKSKAFDHKVAITTQQVINDSPAEVIIEIANDLDCDLIVMSSHGRRGVSRLLLGSQTAEVISHSAVPVLVVR